MTIYNHEDPEGDIPAFFADYDNKPTNHDYDTPLFVFEPWLKVMAGLSLLAFVLLLFFGGVR